MHIPIEEMLGKLVLVCLGREELIRAPASCFRAYPHPFFFFFGGGGASSSLTR